MFDKCLERATQRWPKMSDEEKLRFVQCSQIDEDRLVDADDHNESKVADKRGKHNKSKFTASGSAAAAAADDRGNSSSSKSPGRVVSSSTAASKKSTKPKRDPNMPKQAMSAFFIFMAKLRPTLKAANPDWSTTEISSECGRQWKEMGDAERRPYVEQSKREKKISDRKIEEYKKTLGEQQSVKN